MPRSAVNVVWLATVLWRDMVIQGLGSSSILLWPDLYFMINLHINFIRNLAREGILWSVENKAVKGSATTVVLLGMMSCVRQPCSTKSPIALLSIALQTVFKQLYRQNCRRILDKRICASQWPFSMLHVTVGQTRFDCQPHSVGKTAVIFWILYCVKFYFGITNTVEWHKNGA